MMTLSIQNPRAQNRKLSPYSGSRLLDSGYLKKGDEKMAVWSCEKCGYEKEGRCKPKKCPTCQEQTTFVKK
jgi:rubrerythrin